MINRTSLLALLLAGSVAGVAACDRTPDERPAATTLADDAADAARDAGDAVADATRGVTDRTAAAIETMDVKAALIADDTVDAEHINVDTNHESRTVVLRGSVPTAAQRERAGRIAQEQAPDYTVDNQLVPALN